MFAQPLALVNVMLILLLWGVNAETETTTIKIGFMYSAKPSYTEPVMFNGANVNEELLPVQALVDYWNNIEMYYSADVKFELVYGGHGMDVVS
ncbi:hypothetical protein HK102_006022 [Quaeritorhiza haematococci]|nr:hypothetical protein HK102_006022 [Quaeritorhiza haematococci]